MVPLIADRRVGTILTPSHLVDRPSDIVSRPGDSRGVKADVKRPNKTGSSTRSRLRNENDGLDTDIEKFHKSPFRYWLGSHRGGSPKPVQVRLNRWPQSPRSFHPRLLPPFRLVFFQRVVIVNYQGPLRSNEGSSRRFSGQRSLSLQPLLSEHLSSSQRKREASRVASHLRCDLQCAHPQAIRKTLRRCELSETCGLPIV